MGVAEYVVSVRVTLHSVKLYDHQREILELNPQMYGLWHGTGTGKTITSIALADHNSGTTLVVVPNMGGMLLRKWERAIKDFSEFPEHNWQLVTKEQFRRDFKTLPAHTNVIWDEAHALGNPKSATHKALRAYIKVRKPKRVWLLTATPYLSDAPMSVLAYGQLLGMDWKWLDFRNRFYRERYMGRRVIFEPREGIENELGELMREIGSVVKLEDCIDLPEHIYEEEVFEATKEQALLKKEIDAKESSPLTLYGKYHQIAQGVLIGNEYMADKTCHAHKNARVLELATIHSKLAVFSRYNAHLNLLADMLAEADIPHAIINGETKDKPEVASMLEQSPRAVALIQSATAMGYELPSFTAICYASCSFNYIDYVQSLGRFDRANQLPVRRVIYHLITKDSLDEDVAVALKNKETFSLALHLNKIGLGV